LLPKRPVTLLATAAISTSEGVAESRHRDRAFWIVSPRTGNDNLGDVGRIWIIHRTRADNSGVGRELSFVSAAVSVKLAEVCRRLSLRAKFRFPETEIFPTFPEGAILKSPARAAGLDGAARGRGLGGLGPVN
jgi:hypothetical protein